MPEMILPLQCPFSLLSFEMLREHLLSKRQQEALIVRMMLERLSDWNHDDDTGQKAFEFLSRCVRKFLGRPETFSSIEILARNNCHEVIGHA